MPQSKQADDSTPVAESVRSFPASHSVQAEEDAEENEPRPQSKQVELDVAAVADENVPARQEEQAEYSSPVAASVRYFPEAQSVQEADAAEE